MSKNWFDKKMKHLTSRVSVSTWKIKCKIIPLLKQNFEDKYIISDYPTSDYPTSEIPCHVYTTNNSKSKCYLARFAMKGGQVHEPGQFTKENSKNYFVGKIWISIYKPKLMTNGRPLQATLRRLVEWNICQIIMICNWYEYNETKWKLPDIWKMVEYNNN